jgi:DNA repair exonuclease SbcCD ATPase subunit
MKTPSETTTTRRLKLPLTESTKETLLDLIERAERRLKLGEEAQQKREREASHLANLNGEVSELEKLFKKDRTDSKVLETLTSKKSQLAALNSAIDSDLAAYKEGRDRMEGVETYHDLMTELYDALRPVFALYLQDLISDATAALRPFYTGQINAREAAILTPAVQHYTRITPLLCHPVNPKHSTTRLVEVAKKVLKGENFASFDSNEG